MYIANNLKILRKHFGNSQEEMSKLLKIPRSTYSGYENNVAEPPLHTIIEISKQYDLSIEILLKTNLSSLKEGELAVFLSKNGDAEGHKLRILSQVVTPDNENLVEIIPEKAAAGYTKGYSDPEYMSLLPTLQLPFLSNQKKYRCFPIKGDSMPPVSNGSYVIAEFIENWLNIKNRFPCIVVSKNDGIVFKLLDNDNLNQNKFILHSTNPTYESYHIPVEEIIEIWKFSYYISSDLTPIKPDDYQIGQSLMDIKNEIRNLHINPSSLL